MKKKLLLFSAITLSLFACTKKESEKNLSVATWQASYDDQGYHVQYDSTNSGLYTNKTTVDFGGLHIYGIGDSVTTALWSISHYNVIPSQTGQSGKVLGTNGTQVSWVATGAGEVYYNNGSLFLTAKNYTGNSTTTSGVATFYLTTNGLSSGTAIYSSVYNVVPIVNDANTNYTYGWTYNAGTKALTVTAKYSPGLVVGVLTLLGLPQNVPNGTSVNVTVKGT